MRVRAYSAFTLNALKVGGLIGFTAFGLLASQLGNSGFVFRVRRAQRDDAGDRLVGLASARELT